MEEKKIVNIFWTGGYDSTFRVCQLSKKNIIIQPYYLSYKRKSETNELNAIKKITEKLRNNRETKAIIKDIIFVPSEERMVDEQITKAYHNLRQKEYMGSQYEKLGVFALQHKGIEMSIHKDDMAIKLISKYGQLKKEHGDEGDYYVIDPNNSEKECITLFGNLHFPLVDYTKLEMKDEYEKMNLSDIIDDTWFCHTPKNNQPCGHCNPCRYTIEEGMAYRFSKKALISYKIHTGLLVRSLVKIRKTTKKIIKNFKQHNNMQSTI